MNTSKFKIIVCKANGHLLHLGYPRPGVPGKLEMVEMEVKLEVKMEVEMDAPILQPIYTGAQAPRYT